jgi:hypothetical protein
MRRRGISTIWLVLFVPVFIIFLAMLVNIANVWLARVELENSLEAAALAAVKEWADAQGGDTYIPRRVAQQYAAVNCVRGKPVKLCNNYDDDANPETNPNQNLTCCISPENPFEEIPPSGNLIFGAVTLEDPDCPITFNAGLQPACASGEVLFDASGQGQQTGQDNWWGVSFRPDDNTPATTRITRIEIDLRASGGTGQFNSGATLSSNVSPYAVRCQSGVEQPDIAGFTDPANQITFSFPNPWVLRIDFSEDNDPSGGTDDGFGPCDRFRFGITLDGVGSGNASDDGDSLGADGVGILVVFNDGTEVEGNYNDTTERQSDCCPDPLPSDADCGSLVVHPAQIPDLPCPSSSAANNNGQSYVLVGGGGQRPFAVRVQAIVPVNVFWPKILNCSCAFNYASGCVTAVYDCTTQRPRLISVDRFICPGP